MSKNDNILKLSQLKDAVSTNNLTQVAALAEYINSPLDDKGNTALLLAVQTGNIPLIEKLLFDLNADVNSKNNDLYTALHMAVYDYYCKENQYEITELLLRQKADINAKTSCNQTPLAMSIITSIKRDNTKVTMSLLKYKADPNVQQEPKKITATHIAASSCNYALIKVLVEHEADITITNHRQETALQYMLNDPVLKFDSTTEKYIRTVAFLALLEASRDETNFFSKLSIDVIFLISEYVYKAPYLPSPDKLDIEDSKSDTFYTEINILGVQKSNDCW